jgi:outer membrane lipoprotein-sorting protein
LFRFGSALLAFATLLSAGCVTIERRHDVKKEEIHVQMEASEETLLANYNVQALAAQTIQATVDLIPTTGTTYSGVIEEYHEVPGFILAQRPATIRVIGQAPVVAKNIFDMVSDGEKFRIYIPSKNSFLVGSTALAHPSNKPIENLRPQHVVEALFWPELPPTANVLFEQFDTESARYYIVTLLRSADGGKFEIARKIWYDRADLRVSRVQLLGAGGRLDSDIQYTDWQPVLPPAAQSATPSTGSSPNATSVAAGAPATAHISYARDIHIWRPQDDYKLEIRILKLTLNEPITAEKFDLPQPEGTDLVHVGDEPTGAVSAPQRTTPSPAPTGSGK